MKKIIFSLSGYFLLVGSGFSCHAQNEKTIYPVIIQLPPPKYKGDTSVEEALNTRRSIREYRKEPLTIHEISQLLWAAQGITDELYGGRTSPSAGALYPLEIYLIAANVKDLLSGIYKYIPLDHSLKLMLEGDKRDNISRASLRQESLVNSSAIIAITAIYERTSVKYGKRTERYVNMEVGHAGQNIYLQCVSLGLGTVMIGAFNDESLKQALGLPDNEHPLALYPIGKVK